MVPMLLPLMKWVIVLHVILDKVELVSLLGDLLGTLALDRLNILSKECIMAKRRKDNPVAIKYLRKRQRRAEKSKVIPFHIAHNYKSYALTDGTIFWAENDEMAEDYRQFVGDIEQ